MSDSAPSFPPPPPPPAPEAAAPEASGGKGKKIAAGGAGLALLAAVVGGGAYAYNTLSGGGAQPEDVLPGTSQVYARIDLDPGASQKIELFKLIKKVPELGETIGIGDADTSDVRKLIFDEISGACPDIDYADDVEPWLGDRVGVGASITDEQFVIAVQVKDEGKAEKGIADLFECADESYGIAFDQGYALLSDTQKSVDDALDAAKKESLADRKEFADDMAALGEKGVASAWVDASEVLDALGEVPGFGDALTEEQKAEIKKAGSAAMALRVDGSAIELAGVSNTSEALEAETGSSGDLPGDTVAAASISGAGEQIGQQWDAFLNELNAAFADFNSGMTATSPTFDEEFLEDLDPETREMYEDMMADQTAPEVPNPQDFIDQLEAETGLSLPADLESLLGKTFTLSIGAANLETIPTLAGPDELSQLEVAIRTTGDADDAFSVMSKIAAYASKYGIPLVAEQADGGAVLATSSDAAKKVAGGGDLGDSDRFTSVIPFGDDTAQALYVDVSTILDKLLEAEPPEDLRSAFEQAKTIEAVGISAANVDDRAKFSLRVSFAD